VNRFTVVDALDASLPATTAAHPPITPAHNVQMPAHMSDSRFVAAAAMSNSTGHEDKAAGDR